MRTRARTGGIIVMVVALLTIIVGTLPAAKAQQTPTEQFVCNDRLSIQVVADGRLNFGAFPDPSTCREQISGGSYSLSFAWPQSVTSHTTVRIDGVDHMFNLGTQTTPPTIVNGDSIFTQHNFGDINVAQVVQIGINPLTGQNDAARVSYTVENASQVPHAVGIRFFVDTKVGTSDNPTFFVNDRAITTETDFVGNIPESFTVQHPQLPAQAGGGTLSANFGNTTPSRFVIGQFGTFSGSEWDYQSSGRTIFDSAFGAYWETPQLAPGTTTTYLMTYGVGPGGQGGGGNPIPGCDPAQTQCGTTGDDDISASDGRVVGGPGNDTINLTVDGETNSLTVDGGGGADKIFLNIEDPTNLVPIRISSGGGGDQITVPSHPGVLTPVIKTGGGNDVMKMQAVSGSSARLPAFLQDEAGHYDVNAGGGNDSVTLGTTDDVVDGATGDDKLNGAAGSDEVEGGDGNDAMAGGEGGDVLHGGAGANNFAGGPGRDTCLSDTRRDKFSGCERIRRNHRRNHTSI